MATSTDIDETSAAGSNPEKSESVSNKGTLNFNHGGNNSTPSVLVQTIEGGDIAVGTNPTWVPGKPFINFETTWYAEKVWGLDNLSEGS